jgi:hypothetical protein
VAAGQIWYFTHVKISPRRLRPFIFGTAIVEGMVHAESGCAVGMGATAGNVLLAFGIE